MTVLSLGGTDIKVAGGIYLDLTRGWYEPSEVRGVDTVILTAPGRVARNRVVDRRSLTLEGMVIGTSVSDFYTKMSALFAKLDPTDPQVLSVASAYLGASKTITVRYLNCILDYTKKGDGNGPIVASVSVELESVDPDWS